MSFRFIYALMLSFRLCWRRGLKTIRVLPPRLMYDTDLDRTSKTTRTRSSPTATVPRNLSLESNSVAPRYCGKVIMGISKHYTIMSATRGGPARSASSRTRITAYVRPHVKVGIIHDTMQPKIEGRAQDHDARCRGPGGVWQSQSSIPNGVIAHAAESEK